MSKGDKSDQILPSENELLFKTWEQIYQFMEQVKNTYLEFNYTNEQASKQAVDWGDKIFNDPTQVKKIMQKEWPLNVRELKIKHIIEDTQEKLERSGVPSSMAQNHAKKYAQEMIDVEEQSGVVAWITGQNKIINMAKNNLQTLANEYHERNTGNALSQPIQFADLHSIKDVYNYAKDLALRGDWFPFAAYMASRKEGLVINSPPFSLDPVDYKKALKGDRTNSKILWNNIFKVVGISILATFIYKGLRSLYKKYKQEKDLIHHEQYITIRVIDDKNKQHKTNDNAADDKIGIVLNRIKEIFKIKNGKINHKSKYSEMIVKYPRQPSKENLKHIVEKIQKELENSNIKTKVNLKGKKTSSTKDNYRLFIDINIL
jgi:hypothetical protein